MARTRLDLIAQAHRRLGVLAADEVPTADMVGYGRDTLELILAELVADGVPVAFADPDFIPDALALPLAALLAVDLAPHYEVAPRDARSRCIGRLRSILLPDDRVRDGFPADDYGIIVDDGTGPAYGSFF